MNTATIIVTGAIITVVGNITTITNGHCVMTKFAAKKKKKTKIDLYNSLIYPIKILNAFRRKFK